MLRHVLPAAVAATLAFTAGSVLAQDTPAPAPMEHGHGHGERWERLMAADANHDGKWSLEEWLSAGRSEQAFRRLDANNDGFVTVDELKAGMAARRAEWQARRAAGGGEQPAAQPQ